MRGLVVICVIACMAAVGLAACGGSDDSGSTAASTESSGGSTESADSTESAEGGSSVDEFTAKAEEIAAEASAKQTVQPPSSGPKAVPEKSVFVIPCAMAAEGCGDPARHAMDAIKAIGWKGTLIDPQGDPSKEAAAVQQAISAGADGIILEAIDAQTILGPLQQAKAAGIPVVTFASVDQGSLFSQEIPDNKEFEVEGKFLAAAMYGQAEGDLKMVMMTGTDSRVVTYRMAGTEKFVEECEAAGGECEILTQQNYTIPTIATTAPQLAVSTVRQQPEMTALWVGYDASAAGMIAALQSAGLTQKGFAGAFDANLSQVEMIREGGYQKFDAAIAPTWIGYAQVDSLNRTFAGEETVDEGLKAKLLTEENVPASGPWKGDIDPVPAYLKIWGK